MQFQGPTADTGILFGAEYHGGCTEAKISQVRGSPVLSKVLALVLALVEFVVICASV